MPELLEKFDDYYPLFSSTWCYAYDDVSRETLKKEARKMVNNLEDDGGLRFAYPDLPWWRPVITLDGLVALKRYGDYVLPIDWLYASKDDMQYVLDGTGWKVSEFIDDETDAFVGVIEKCR